MSDPPSHRNERFESDLPASRSFIRLLCDYCISDDSAPAPITVEMSFSFCSNMKRVGVPITRHGYRSMYHIKIL